MWNNENIVDVVGFSILSTETYHDLQNGIKMSQYPNMREKSLSFQLIDNIYLF